MKSFLFFGFSHVVPFSSVNCSYEMIIIKSKGGMNLVAKVLDSFSTSEG